MLNILKLLKTEMNKKRKFYKKLNIPLYKISYQQDVIKELNMIFFNKEGESL